MGPPRHRQTSEPLFGPGVSDKVKSGFNHFNDVFSAFTKHIAPAFNHERPDRSVQMRLYTMHKGQHLLIFIMFICLFFIALLMGMAGPRIVVEHVEYATKLKMPDNKTSPASRLPGGPFNIVTPTLTAYQQQLWLSAQLVTKVATEQATFTKKCTVSLLVEGIVGQTSAKVVGGRSHNRTRTIRCAEKTCDSFIVMHLGVLEYPRYLINMSVYGLEDVDRHFNVEDVVFTVTTYNPQFTKMEIWFRFFFAISTCIAATVFLCSLRQFALDDWSIEQKWVALLFPLLLGFDNPLFAWTLLSSSLFPASIDAFLQTTFLFALLLFWLCIFHGLRQTERGLYRFYLPKLLLVGTLWFSALTMALLEERNELRDPSFSYQLNTAHYKNFQLYLIAMLAVYVVYLVYLTLRAFGELRSMNFLDARLKFHAASLTVVLFLTLSIVASRFGSGMLEDNLIARVYTSYDTEGQFLAFYTVLNCYVYVMAYVYSPSSAQARDSPHVMRDNPAFSMINESDEETEAMLQHEEETTTNNLLQSEQPPQTLVNLGHDDD